MKTKLIAGVLSALVAFTGFGIAASRGSSHDRAVATYHAALLSMKKSHDLSKMRESLRKCKTLDPTYASPYFNLALAQARLGDLAWAVADMTEYRKLSQKPETDKSMRYLEAFRAKQASLFNAQVIATAEALKKGDSALALARAKRTVEIAPDKYQGHMLCARVYLRMRDEGKATAALEKAFHLAPPAKEKSVRAALQLAMTSAGSAHFKKGNYSKAAECFVSAWQVDPTQERIGLAAASTSMLAGNSKTALSIAKTISDNATGQGAEKSGELQKKIRELEEIKKKL